MPAAATSEPVVITRVQVVSHASVECECRHSKATARTIRPTAPARRAGTAPAARCVPAGEGGEHRADGGDQPDLVAVPQRADGAQHQVPLGGTAAEHRQQRGDAEVEALEQQEAGPQQRDGGEPEGLQVHGVGSGRGG
jgi:hypothetical protein